MTQSATQAHGGVDTWTAATRPVVVVDCGGQYSQLIARRIRETQVFSFVVRNNVDAARIRELDPWAIIISGGPASVYEDGAPTIDPEILNLGVPILGICYGMQLVAQMAGGRVESNDVSEFGRTSIEVVGNGGELMRDVPSTFDCWMSHCDSVVEPPTDAQVTARTNLTAVAAFEDSARQLYGLQFHPEVVHTQHGADMLRAFLDRIAHAPAEWTADAVIEAHIERIRTQVGSRQVICALSGGVDSSVAALLVHRAVGDQLTCVFVDHGLLRESEAQQVVATFGEHFEVPLVHVDARVRFLDMLAGVEDPEAKRRIIGTEFIRVFEDEAARLGGVELLVQGTLYSDVIESGGSADGAAATIKSHHNVGGLPDDLSFELIEPLRDLFKDEVRAVGEALGLPREMVWRQPFPGPGLAIRIIGDVTAERLEIVRRADAIIQHEIRVAGIEAEVWQCFAVLPIVRSVGVQGDGRTYAYPIIIRAVTSDDAMTADWARLPYPVLQSISTRIVNEISDVNRVALDITSKPPATIEWE